MVCRCFKSKDFFSAALWKIFDVDMRRLRVGELGSQGV
jgi:hypothetical protein